MRKDEAISVRAVDNRLNSILFFSLFYFYFSVYFIFIFIILDLDKGV